MTTWLANQAGRSPRSARRGRTEWGDPTTAELAAVESAAGSRTDEGDAATPPTAVLDVHELGERPRGRRVPPAADPSGPALAGGCVLRGASGWRGEALCAQSDPDAWFPEVGERADVAKAICGRCPVREQCLAEALDHDVYGVWGGLTRRERAQLRRGAAVGLPRAA